MLVGGIHVVVYFVIVVHLHLYLDFASHQRLLLDHLLSFLLLHFTSFNLITPHEFTFCFFCCIGHYICHIKTFLLHSLYSSLQMI